MLSLCCRGMAISCPTPTQTLPANRPFKFNSPSNLLTFPSNSIHLPYTNTINLTHSCIEDKKGVIRFRHFYTSRNPIATNLSIRASSSNSSHSAANSSVSDSDRGRVIIVSSAITLVLAIANRVLYKLALVPMKHYPFFLAQISTFAYVAIYFSVLHLRYHTGIVTDEMMALPKFPFVQIGFLEALGVVAGMSAGAMLPGPAIPILSQTFLLWQLSFSVILLRRRYMWNQIAGCLLVAAGLITAVASGSDSGQMLSGIGFLWPTLMIASSAFQAGASIIKESAFIDAATCLKGKFLDIFVVNSLGSGFQALFVLLFLPFLSNLKGIPFSQLPLYMKNGAGCFFNIGADVTAASCLALGCDGAPLLPLLFIVTNIAFNISLLNLVKLSSAVVSSLAATLSVPISICILSLPLPYLPGGVNLSPLFLLGCMILVAGLILYNIPQPLEQNSDITVK